jgi:hypothetical protein
MRRYAHVIFSIVLVLACCFIIGCSSLPSAAPAQPQGKVNTGVSAGNSTDMYRTNYTFEEVVESVYQIPLDPVTHEQPSPDEMHILSITGVNLDDQANATGWTVILQYKNSTKIVTFDKYGQSVTDWAPGYSAEEVNPHQVLPPKTLFDQNRGIIFKNTGQISTESRKLALSGGNYTLVIHSQNGTRMLGFDANTGVLTSSNDR